MECFASEELRQIDLDKETWIKVPIELSYADAVTAVEEFAKGNNVGMVLACVKEWNLKDAEGHIIKISKENIDKFKMEVGGLISRTINDYVLEVSNVVKKKKKPSKKEPKS